MYADPTPRQVARVSKYLFKLMAEKYGGDSTLNELRVMNAVINFEMTADGQCGVTNLASETEIPISTVSRSVGNLLDKGFLSECIDPDDRRRHIVSLGPRSQSLQDDIAGIIECIIQERA